MAAQVSRRALFGLAVKPQPATAPAAQAQVAQLNGRCISVQGVTCRLCGDACEPAALRFRLLTGGRSLPVIDETRCTGCGECITPCPVAALSLVPAAPAEA